MVAREARFADWASLTPARQGAVIASAAERAQILEPKLNAFVKIMDALMCSTPTGPLGGVPYAAKDIFATTFRRASGGLSDAIDLGIAGSAEALHRLDAAGGRLIGITAMTELAYEPSGYNSIHGRIRNPWNLDFVSGGSSAGSAAAVASGTAVVALGSDTGGSVRIPANCCGVTGWKPTFGIVPNAGALPLAPTLDVIGLLARSAADMQPAFEVLASDNLEAVDGIERAVVLTDIFAMTEPSVARACQEGIDALETCGVVIDRGTALDAINVIDAHALIVMQAEAARVHVSLIDHPRLHPILRKRLAKGLAIDDAALAASSVAGRALAEDFIKTVFAGADVALLPVMPIRTPPASETDPASESFRPRTLYELSQFTRFVNMLGFPAVAAPVGFDDRGLPVCLQIVGRPLSDQALVAFAHRMQSKTNWHARVPPSIADLIPDMEGIAA